MSKHSLKNSGRRAFLRGAGGVALGLPLLEYTHGKAWAADGFAKRAIIVLNHGGETMCVFKDGTRGGEQWGTEIPNIDHWFPKSGSRFGIAHEVFEGTPIYDKMIVARGIDNRVCTQGRYNGDHTLSNCSVLTAEVTKCESGGSPSGGKCPSEESDEHATAPSIDWVLAQRLNAKYGGASKPFNLFVPGHYYGSGFYWGNGGEQRTEGEYNPRSAFDQIFAGVTSSEEGPSPEEVRARAIQGSQLNGLMNAYRSFSSRLGMLDKQILDAHLDHLADLEKEIQAVEVSAGCVVPNRPQGYNDYWAAAADPQTVGPLHAKLIVAAMRCGLTHVADLEIADFLTPWTPSGLQLESGYDIGHSLGHWVSDLRGNADLIRRWELEMKENREWRMGLVKIIADGLDAVPEGDGTMLDNSVLFYTNEFSCGGIHSSTDGPYMIIGGAGGYFKTGRFVELNKDRQSDPNTRKGGGNVYSNNNVFVSLLNAIGETDTTFGGSRYMQVTGGISELRG